MASTEPDIEYFLQRGTWRASARLTHQHNLYRQRLGYLVHPDIESGLKLKSSAGEGIQILDLAAGNGVWTIDAANSYPKALVTGLDISNEQFPSNQIIPGNLQFGTLNILEDVPEELVGAFDLVHVRFLLPGLFRRDSGEIAVKNIMKLVKSGGWVQWQEIGMPGWSEVRFEHGEPVFSGEVAGVQHVINEHMDILNRFAWINRLDRVIQAAGDMDHVKIIKPGVKKETLRSETELMLWTWEEGLPGIAKVMGKPEQMDEVKAALKAEELKASKGVYSSYITLIAVGRKA